MPVSLLLCEGVANSPDVRVLAKLLGGLCEVRPLGGKYGMGDRIKARREILGESAVFGILDGDFISQWEKPTNKPRRWQTSDGSCHFGWRWERKEIENYLIDPLVVEKALASKSLNMEEYRQALGEARDSIALYQAARTALSANRLRFEPLRSSWGSSKGNKIDHLDESTCREGIEKIVLEHRQNQIVEVDTVLQAFEIYKGECQEGGVRFLNYFHAFAGKDLLAAMDVWLRKQGWNGARAFREAILKGIRRTEDDIANWLPEWDELRQIVAS